MVQTPENLPKFAKPPVVEVVLSTQFQQLPGMHIGQLGLVWDRFRSKFPRVQQQMPLPHIIERKGVHAPALMPTVSLMIPSDQPQRVWLISEDDSDLVQIQSDRFMRNWRRYHNVEIGYPSYDGHIRSEFVEDYETFRTFVSEQRWGELEVDQCEMTYVNHIRPNQIWSDFSQLDRVFKGWSGSYPRLANHATDLLAFRARHEVAEDDGNFIGHLFVELDSAFVVRATGPNSELDPIFQLQLIVRGRPLEQGSVGVMRFMDMAHSIIVKSFADVTTPEMHSIWERTQ
ncbi:MAG: TIGR04255 family protein [Steroidobacteraceae bacterium]